MPHKFKVSRALSRFLVVALLVALILPAAALAASPAIWVGGTVSLADIGGGKEPTYVVRLAIKEDVKLPVSVAVPIPAGSTLIWAGEVMGTDTANDISATDARIVTSGKAASVVFTVTKSHVVQVELTPPADMINENAATVDMTWTPDTAVGRMLMGIMVPAGYRGVAGSELTTVVPVAEGASSYVREYASMKAGETGSLKLTIVAGASSSAEPTATGSEVGTGVAKAVPVQPPVEAQSGLSSGPIAVLAGLLVLAALVAAIVVVNRKRGSRPDSTE